MLVRRGAKTQRTVPTVGQWEFSYRTCTSLVIVLPVPGTVPVVTYADVCPSGSPSQLSKSHFSTSPLLPSTRVFKVDIILPVISSLASLIILFGYLRMNRQA
jgi:hypothetical protein